MFYSGKSGSKFGKKVFMAGNKVSGRDSSFVKYKFQFHLIFFNSVNTENVVCPFDVQTFKIHQIQNKATFWKHFN